MFGLEAAASTWLWSILQSEVPREQKDRLHRQIGAHKAWRVYKDIQGIELCE